MRGFDGSKKKHEPKELLTVVLSYQETDLTNFLAQTIRERATMDFYPIYQIETTKSEKALKKEFLYCLFK